jgi:uncharacterized protein (DUF302 family)
MLQVTSAYPLSEIEAALSLAAQKQGAAVLAVTDFSHLLDAPSPGAAKSFTICHHHLYGALMRAEPRLAAFLPMRIAASADGDKTRLEAISPRTACQLLGRDDLERLSAPLESLLKTMMEAVATRAAHPHHPHHAHISGLGATEMQMNVRGSVPQRIDCHGTKVEDLAGVGQHDSSGG